MRYVVLCAHAALAAAIAYALLGPRPAPDRRLAGLRVAFIVGGHPSQAFSQRIAHGARDAARDLGCHLDLLWNHWDEERNAALAIRAQRLEPDVICVPGAPYSGALGGFLDEAARAGCTISVYNTPLPGQTGDAPGNDAHAADHGYTGLDNWAAGQSLARAALRHYGLGAGARAIVCGVPRQGERGRRALGCVDALETAGLYVELLDLDEAAEPWGGPLRERLGEDPPLDLIIWEAGSVSIAAGMLEDHGIAPGAIALAGFDLDQAALHAMKAGYAGLVWDQQPYLQGYLSVLQGALAHRYGFAGLHIDTGAGAVDLTRAQALQTLVAEGVR